MKIHKSNNAVVIGLVNDCFTDDEDENMEYTDTNDTENIQTNDEIMEATQDISNKSVSLNVGRSLMLVSNVIRVALSSEL
jgi:hypothetical protein